MAPFGLLSVLIGAAVLAAGCVGAEPASEAPPQLAPQSEQGLGTLEGTIVDPSLAPIAGAQVGLIGTDRGATTDESGYFVINNLVPGEYQVAAQALGYQSVARVANVEADGTLTLRLQLEPLPVEEPFNVVLVQRGMFGCGFAYRPNVGGIVGASVCGALSIYANVTAVDQFLLLWNLGGPYEAWDGNAFEMEWQSTQLLGGGLWVRWETNNCAGSLDSQFASIRGRSPLRQVYGETVLDEKLANNTKSDCATADECDESACLLMSRVFPHTETLGDAAAADVGVAFQQPFTQYWTQFFASEPPETYSAMPDS